MSPKPGYDAAVIGAGFGGMGAAIQLKRLGFHNLVILEREDDLGGTWHVNRYPGPAVDITSVRMTERLGDSVFNLGDCATSRSYYFNPHGEAAILRPTSTLNAFREAGRFPLDAYTYA